MIPAASIHGATILIIDDIPANLGVAVETLETKGFQVLVAQDGEEGLQRAEFAHPDLILLDVMMPGLDGFEVCRRLKASPETRDIPVIFLTALGDIRDKVFGFDAGGVDYVTKPFEVTELLARVSTHLSLAWAQSRLQEKNRLLEHEIVERQRIGAELDSALEQLKESEERYRHQATHDSLTGLPNRLLLMDRLQQTIARAKRRQERFCVCFMDVDRFKWINDTYGHDAGDVVLRTVSGRVVSVLRKSDTLARIGGDEFVLILHDPGGADESSEIMSRIVAALAEPVRLAGQDVTVTCSLGCCVFPGDSQSAEELLEAADKAMYEVKKARRSASSTTGE